MPERDRQHGGGGPRKVAVDTEYKYYYDSASERLYFHCDNDGERPGVWLFRNGNYWEYCAIRRYLNETYQNTNVLFFGADRHFLALDDGGDGSNDPWPHALFGPLHCHKGTGHDSKRLWRVDDKVSVYDIGCGKLNNGVDDPPGGKYEIGGYGLINVVNSDDRLHIECYERDGNLANNSALSADDYHGYTDSDELGDMEMDVIFVSTLINETFDTATGTGTPDGCDEVWVSEGSDD